MSRIRSRTARSLGALTLAGLVLLLAGCGDGGTQAVRDQAGGTAASSAELADVELALAELDARLTRLEDAVAELTRLLGGDTSVLGDLPELVTALQRSNALFGVVFERLDALDATTSSGDPCEGLGYGFCPEDPVRLPYAQ